MKINFEHKQAAHCENGVTTSLLQYNGVNKITEPLAFGIGSGLFFVNLPFLKINNGPAIAFRTMPGLIFKRTCNALDIPVYRKKFSSKESAEGAKDKNDKNKINVCTIKRGENSVDTIPMESRQNGDNSPRLRTLEELMETYNLDPNKRLFM